VEEDREVREEELHKVCREQAEDLHEVTKGDFNPCHWIWKGTWQGYQCIVYFQSKEEDSRGYL
jgi:hypothetical protein